VRWFWQPRGSGDLLTDEQQAQQLTQVAELPASHVMPGQIVWYEGAFREVEARTGGTGLVLTGRLSGTVRR
jgi:hypothetical protein